ncbi:hypothetical protein CRENBAI_007600 [Crenichthys baileyi]|uniref:Uncharacterized protein n=1 Tax=Crenichthys baileyi TaxID=28760 RepID=A0AAV9RUM9_9TELE
MPRITPPPTAHGHSPTGELYPRKANEATTKQRKFHTQLRYKYPAATPPPPHSASRQQGKGPTQCHPSPRPQAQQGRHRRALSSQWSPRPHTKMGRTHPARGARATEGSIGGRPPQGPGTPPTPHPDPGGAPGCQPPTLPHGTPHRTKQAGQPLHQSEATSQSTLHTPRRSPTPPQLTDRPPKPGAEIQGNPNDPERVEEPAPAPDKPQDPNLNPSSDPDQEARSLSWPLTPDGKQQTRRAHDQHAQPLPNHGAEPTERPVPDAWHQSPATTRKAGQQNMSHTNTEATNKKQNGRPTQMQHHTSFHTSLGARWRLPTPSTQHPEETTQQTSKPYLSIRPRAPMQTTSPATPALPYKTRRAEPPRTEPPPRHHSITNSGGQYAAPKAEAMHKAHTMQVRPHQPSKKPPAKVHPREKKTHSIQVQENMLDPHAPPEVACEEKNPHPKPPQKAESPQSQKPKTQQEAETSQPKISPARPGPPNIADPSEPPPPDRTIRNCNLDKEPESTLEPSMSKRCPSPPKANPPNLHPDRKKPTPTPTFGTNNSPEPHKTLDKQVDSAPPPPIDPLPRQ